MEEQVLYLTECLSTALPGVLCSGTPHPVLEAASVFDIDLHRALAAHVTAIGDAVNDALKGG